MKFYIGVTDHNWFNYLKSEQPDELNFWQPGGKQTFKAIQPNNLFLFKLHSPNNFIVGGGFFVRHSFLPVSLAWEAFGNKNGTSNYIDFRNAIHKYRKSDFRAEPDPTIGCIILSTPFFFEKHDWIPVPPDWKPNIVQGKTYDTNTEIGQNVFRQVEDKIRKYLTLPTEKIAEEINSNRYGKEQIILPRIGQGAFKVMVTEAYHRRCAISGEMTLPVLEAAHIKPFALDGPNQTSNGLLLRRDVHTLFDRGYITINEDYRIEVSKRIKEDYGNGKEYYAFHGNQLKEIPEQMNEQPSEQFLLWHNENVYLG
jgi:putative restriction endonuclease